MKKIYSLLIVLLIAGGAFAQGKKAVIPFTDKAPVIDGIIDENEWDASTPQPIAVNFQKEVPTLSATTGSTWQALYDDTNMYVVVFADDDNHWPAFENNGATDNWNYDKPEVYWDVNEVLADQGGAKNDNTGHYQLANGFTADSYDTPIQVAQSAPGNKNPGGTIAYSLLGEGYVYEHAVPFDRLTDKDGNVVAPVLFKGTGREMGFDVTIIDADENVTTARQRANWCNAGGVDEAWNNMDDAGRITFLKPGEKPDAVNSLKVRSMAVTPNPATDFVNIQANFNRVVISNILGQQVKSVSASTRKVNVSDLAKGVYVIKAYQNNNLVGTAKITKE